MTDTNTDVRRAIADVELLRRVLNQVEQKKTEHRSVGLFGATLNANILLQGGAFCIALVFVIIEVLSGRGISAFIMLGREAGEFPLWGIGLMACLVLAMIVSLYLVLWRAAQNSGEEFNTYIARNFRYARHLSYTSDLLMKFIAISLILLVGQPQWIAPLLLAFTGDYLLQGRLFTLPTRVGAVLGVFCMAAGFIQFVNDSSELLVPFVVFIVITGISLGRLLHLYRQQNGFGD
mgnify:FL=1